MDKQQRIAELEKRIQVCQEKLLEMAKQSVDSGGRYGDEYLDEQIRVHQAMISMLKNELADLKRSRSRQF